MCAQGAVWYFTFFYMQVFLEKSLGVPGATKDMLLIVMTLVSAPLYVFFGWLSDRVGRKPVMLGGMLLALALYFPGSHLIARAANPAVVEAQARTPVVVETDLCDLLVAVRPDRHGQVHQRLRHRQERADHARRGLLRPAPRPTGRLGWWPASESCRSRAAKAHADLKALKAAVGTAVNAELEAVGYPKSADPNAIDYPLLLTVLLGFVVAATALYGPQAAALVEMFPTRIRYTAMSLPYHVGTGWVGGFLPVTSFAIVAATGDIYAGLWYAVAFTALSAVVTMFFLKETRGKPLEQCGAVRGPVNVDRLLGLGQHPADRQFRAVAVGDRLLQQRLLLVARDGDQHRPRRQDRRAGQSHARHRCFWRQRVGHDADGMAAIGGGQRLLEIGAGEDRCRMSVLADPQPGEVEREFQFR